MKTTDRILHKIKREGAVTAKHLAEEFAMTTMGARQHLQSLEDDGYLAFHDVRVKVGRPTRHWNLTGKGHAFFSDRHSDLAVHVLDAVEDIFGEQGLLKVANERGKKTFSHYQAAMSDCETTKEKLHTLTALRDSEGYMAELAQSEQGYILIENHCPICKAATRCPSLCQSELNIFRKLLGETVLVERSEHIINGQRRCCYLIQDR